MLHCYLTVEGPSLHTGECPWSLLDQLACPPADDKDDNDDVGGDDKYEDDEDTDDDTAWHTCPVSTPLLSKTRAANASSASAWEENMNFRILLLNPI